MNHYQGEIWTQDGSRKLADCIVKVHLGPDFYFDDATVSPTQPDGTYELRRMDARYAATRTNNGHWKFEYV